MHTHADQNARPDYDVVLQKIADYVCDFNVTSQEAYDTARYCLLDTLGCGILALNYPECVKLLGPVVPGLELAQGARVPGTSFTLDPVQAAFNIGTMIRWLDFNDTWLAAEWGHPSDNLGALLSVMDYQNRQGKSQFTVRDLLTAMIKAHEIQGILALENSYNRVGLDHVVLVKVASTAITMKLLGGDRDAILRALSHAWLDGQSLRTYRHAPNTGSRKSWAAGDATSRAVRLALICQAGEMGYPSALTAPKWGFYDVLFKGNEFSLPQPFTSYVMENVLFKISFPAEFHSQTAVEAAVKLHPSCIHRLDDIEKIVIDTHESAVRIISKTGPLHNPADRDHCLQYMVAIGLIHGNLTADHYEENVAKDPRIDALREKMQVRENPQFTKDYLDPAKRSIANTLQIFFKNGERTPALTIEYPLGHRRRRAESIPVLIQKARDNFLTKFPEDRVESFMQLFANSQKLDSMRVDEWMELLVK